MPISWKQAFDEISAKMQEIKEKYGNEAFYINYTTRTIINRCTQGPWARLLNLYGDYLNYHNSYSTAQISNAMNFFYGGSPASDIYTLCSAKLAIFFRANHVETRMGGGGVGYAYQKAFSTRNRCSFDCCANLCDDKKIYLIELFLINTP
ncbi:TPA: molybdopterin-dependent oxidoreductase [Campylobacter jejuni]